MASCPAAIRTRQVGARRYSILDQEISPAGGTRRCTRRDQGIKRRPVSGSVSNQTWVNLFVDLAAPTVQSKADIMDRPKLSVISGISIARQKEVPELNGKRKATCSYDSLRG